jgi:hypothetical protein
MRARFIFALVEMERRKEERHVRIERLKREAQRGTDDIEAGRFIDDPPLN